MYYCSKNLHLHLITEILGPAIAGLTEEPLLLPAGEDLSIQVSWQSHILLLLKYFFKIFSFNANIHGIFKKRLHTNYSLVICKNGIYFCYINLEFCDLAFFTYLFQEWLLLFLTSGDFLYRKSYYLRTKTILLLPSQYVHLSFLLLSGYTS